MAWLFPLAEARPELVLQSGQPDIYSGLYDNGAFQSLTFVNSVVGWDTFFNAGYTGADRVIANIEAGLIWDGHEAFLRPEGSSPAVAKTLVGTGALGQLDFHATMVGHVLAGSGYVAGSNPAQYYYSGLGMAPSARLWSGALATAYSTTQTGSFETTTQSTLSVYRPSFQGIDGVKPDVINSSWGGADLQAPEMQAIEGLAQQNPTVALVVAAGNGGSDSPSAPGSVFNGITVGSLGGASFLDPSSFSSHGAADFYNPATGQTVTGVRAAVDIAAPGENFFLAAYLGNSGSLGASNDPNVQTPPPTDLYFLNQSGTSFAAPIVSGGIALLKEAAANDLLYNLNGVASADDTRVIKSVLMAGATRTTGWDNGQQVLENGAIKTTQGLDLATGAGALNLDQAAQIYLLSGTRDVAGTGGGLITSSGWDFGTAGDAQPNDYYFNSAFDSPVDLTVSLNWFANHAFDNLTGTDSDLGLADLKLQVFEVLDGGGLSLFAESDTSYDNTEFLRIRVGSGTYSIRITRTGAVYETVAGSTQSESYGLAWQVTQPQAVPEPTTLVLILIPLLLLFAGRSKKPWRSEVGTNICRGFDSV